MEVSQALQMRKSVRKFTEEPVSEEALEALMQAAMSGPSACARYPWQFWVVTDDEKRAALRGATRFSGITAPMAIVVCGDLNRALGMGLAEFWVQDCSAATENILLQAVELGLGSVWCGVYPQKKATERVQQMLGLDEKTIPLNIIWLGHPAGESQPGGHYDAGKVHRV